MLIRVLEVRIDGQISRSSMVRFLRDTQLSQVMVGHVRLVLQVPMLRHLLCVVLMQEKVSPLVDRVLLALS